MGCCELAQFPVSHFLIRFKEYQENERELVLDNVQINHVITLYGCKNSVIQIKGKVNGITMSRLFLESSGRLFNSLQPIVKRPLCLSILSFPLFPSQTANHSGCRFWVLRLLSKSKPLTRVKSTCQKRVWTRRL